MNLSKKAPVVLSAPSAREWGSGATRGDYSDVVRKMISFGSREYSVLTRAELSQSTPGSELFRIQMIAQVFAVKMSLASKAVEAMSAMVRKFQQQ
jgi:hypothetical protein